MTTIKCQAFINQAFSEIQNGDFQRSRILLQSAYEQGCGMFAGVHVGFGGIYEHTKEIEKALAAFDYAVKVEPVSASFNNRGRMYDFIGDLQNALRDYQKALELMPDNPRAHFNIGGVYLEQGKFEEALPYLREAARLGYPPAQQLLHQIQTQRRPPNANPPSQSRWELLPQEERCLLHALILLARFAYQVMGPHAFLRLQQKDTFFGISTKKSLEEDIRWITTIESLYEFDAQGFQGERNGATLQINNQPSFLVRVTMPKDEFYEVSIYLEHNFKDVPQTGFLKQKHQTWNIQQGDLEEKLNSLVKDGIMKLVQQKLTYSP